MMDPEIKERWVKALRSERYAQGRGYLRQTTHPGIAMHCCLGVLCEVQGITRKENKERYSSYILKGETFPFSATLPRAYRKEIGLSHSEEATLISMNDVGSSFKEIADWIEKEL